MISKIIKKIICLLFGEVFVEDYKRALLIRKIKSKKGGYFGLNGLDKKLERYVDYDNGFYVELGANDGYSQSNSYYFELNRGWKGILVEPVPHNFIFCSRLRSKNNAIYCNACVDFNFQQKYVDMNYANLMTRSENLESDLPQQNEYIERSQRFLKPWEKEFQFGAQAIPLSELLDISKAPKVIDFLSLDVEGAELTVLKGIDFNKYNFHYMLIECQSIEPLESYLLDKSYKLIDKLSHHDYLFKYS